MIKLFVPLASSALLLSACGGQEDAAQERAEDQVEATAEASAVAAGSAVAALGLTEAQLLEADLLGASNVELGDVTRIERAADGTVDGLLIEIEDSNPDRYVEVPLTGLTPVTRGNDTDLQSTMTREQLEALPTVTLPAV